MLTQTDATIQDLLTRALDRYKPREVASSLGVDTRTIHRWVAGDSAPKEYIAEALDALLTPRFAPQNLNPEFTFIDTFAGIGGIRHGFEQVGGECVFTSEWNAYSAQTYKVNFGDSHKFIGDIVQQQHEVPDHDLLLGGFPCQPFSIAGVSKKRSLGRPDGFGDPTQGTLFFELKEIIKLRQPVAFVLENVKNLKSHDRGKTFQVIMDVLQNELGYEVHEKIIDGGHFTPQHRERIIIVGFSRSTNFSWDSLTLPPIKDHSMEEVLHRADGSEPFLAHDGSRFFNHETKSVQEKYTLTPRLWEYLQNYAAKHKAAGNGFGFGLVTEKGRSRTLSARYYKDGSEILVSQGEGRPRRLTPRECARLMGFPDSFVIPVSDTQAYKQFGNSVVAPVFAELARAMKPHILAVKAQIALEAAQENVA